MYVALLLILPVEGERDAFSRVCRLRRHSYLGSWFSGWIFVTLFAVMLTFRLFNQQQQSSSIYPLFLWAILGVASLAYSNYQKASMQRLKSDNKYLVKDIYEIFWPFIGVLAVAVVASLLIILGMLIMLLFVQKGLGLALGTILFCIPVLSIHLYLAEKIWMVYRSCLEVIGVK
ncbi:MAG: hypothetical protein ABL893_16325 [Hyphomicrobium sp.]